MGLIDCDGARSGGRGNRRQVGKDRPVDFDALETRDVAVEPARAVLLIVDVQNFSARRSGGEFRGLSTEETEARYGWFFRKIETEAVPNMQRLIAVCRAAGHYCQRREGVVAEHHELPEN